MKSHTGCDLIKALSGITSANSLPSIEVGQTTVVSKSTNFRILNRIHQCIGTNTGFALKRIADGRIIEFNQLGYRAVTVVCKVDNHCDTQRSIEFLTNH